MGAPPLALVGTAVQLTTMLVPCRDALGVVGSAGATATERPLANVAVPWSSLLVTVTSTCAASVRVTLIGTVMVAPSVETVSLPVVATLEPLGNDTVAPEW